MSLITEKEKELLKKTAEIYNEFVELDDNLLFDVSDFANAINTLQRIISLRIARRDCPELWKNNSDL